MADILSCYPLIIFGLLFLLLFAAFWRGLKIPDSGNEDYKTYGSTDSYE